MFANDITRKLIVKFKLSLALPLPAVTSQQHLKAYLACENIRFSSLFAAGDVSSSSRNVPSGEEQGETDVFAG